MVVKREKNEYAIQAVGNALDVLEQFKGSDSELGITTLSNRLGLHKNNIFRVLATLQNRGYIEQNLSTENYRLGIKVLELGKAFLDHSGLTKVAKTVLDDLALEVNENCYLGVLRESKIFYVEHAESTQVLRVASRIGTSLSPLCTAAGKAILSFATEKELEKVINDNGFVKKTENTILSRPDYEKDLQFVRENNYALDDQEYNEGVTCIAYPVRNYEDKVIAGISISGPSTRLTNERLKEIYIPNLKKYGLKLSRSIGYFGESE